MSRITVVPRGDVYPPGTDHSAGVWFWVMSCTVTGGDTLPAPRTPVIVPEARSVETYVHHGKNGQRLYEHLTYYRIYRV